VGDQSGGKSSLLEAIVGIEIFPKGSSMVTRRPLNLVLQHVETGFWVEFENGVKIYNLEEVRERIVRENKTIKEGDVSDEPIFVKVCSSEVSNLQVIDLPGLINIAGVGQDKLLPKKIKTLVKPYIEDENNIPLVVISATEDPANSNGLREVHRFPGAVERSIGVVTKIDLKKHFDDTILTLQNQSYPLGYGYFGTVMRGPQQIIDRVSLSDMVKLEREFFKTSGLDVVPHIRLGIPYLKTQLTEILVAKICPQLPSIINQLDRIIAELEESESFLARLANEPDLSVVAKDLEFLVRELHPESSSRSSFETELRTKLKELVASILSPYRERHFSNFKVGTITAEDKKEDVDQVEADYNNTVFYANEILKEYSSAEDLLQKTNMDRLTRLFIFGDNVPDLISNRITDKLKIQYIHTGNLLAYFVFSIPKDQGKTRIEWQKRLSFLIDDLIDPENPANIQNSAYSLLITELGKFIQNIKIEHKESAKTDLARKFGNFLFEKIGSAIYYSKLEPSISHHILAENRIIMEWHKLGIALAQITNFPPYFTNWNIFTKKISPMVVEIYGDIFTKAYFEILTDRIADNLFRSFGVNLLNPLILECIKYSLKTFKGEAISIEAQDQTKKLTELRDYRDVLRKALLDYEKKDK